MKSTIQPHSPPPLSSGRIKSTAFACGFLLCAGLAGHAESPASAQHINVFQKDGRFAAWPTNGGMWARGDEILICYTEADHRDATGHSYDPATAWSRFARSLDGGETWTREDALAQGITGAGHDHRVHQGEPLRNLDDAIDFSHPDFALLIHRRHMHKGDSFFYYTYDRGKSWEGPFKFPLLDTIGLAARTDYLIDGPREATVFLTATKSDGREGRIAPFRTKDGGLTWEQLADPVSDNINNPPALIQLPDGRLVLAYVFRNRDADGSGVCAKVSADGGMTRGPEIVLRGGEGASGDAGYPRIVSRPDGKLLISDYWNHALRQDMPPYPIHRRDNLGPGIMISAGQASS